jgi:hypothetical protein
MGWKRAPLVASTATCYLKNRLTWHYTRSGMSTGGKIVSGYAVATGRAVGLVAARKFVTEKFMSANAVQSTFRYPRISARYEAA